MKYLAILKNANRSKKALTLEPVTWDKNLKGYYRVTLEKMANGFWVALDGNPQENQAQNVPENALKDFIFKADLKSPYNNWADAAFVFETVKKGKRIDGYTNKAQQLQQAFSALKGTPAQ